MLISAKLNFELKSKNLKFISQLQSINCPLISNTLLNSFFYHQFVSIYYQMFSFYLNLYQQMILSMMQLEMALMFRVNFPEKYSNQNVRIILLLLKEYINDLYLMIISLMNYHIVQHFNRLKWQVSLLILTGNFIIVFLLFEFRFKGFQFYFWE